MKVYDKKSFVRLLIKNGYIRNKKRGKHDIYTKNGVSIALTQHSKRLSMVTTDRIIKQYDLKEDI